MSGVPATERDRVASGIGGTGAGTALVGGGLEVGTDTTVGKILLFVSPLTSVVVGSVIFYAQVTLGRYFENREAARARKTLERAIDNQRLPEHERERFREILAEFEHGVVARELERVQVIGAVPGAPDQ